MDRNEIKSLAELGMDARRNRVRGNYSADNTQKTIREAVMDITGGRTTMTPQDIRDGKCNELFALVEETVNVVRHDVLTTDPFFMQFVDYRNLAIGDKNEFYIPDDTPLVVSEIGHGSQALRRQRLFGGQTYTVPTRVRGIKVYEELLLLMSGRMDFVQYIDAVEKAFRADTMEQIYTAWSGVIPGLEAPFAYTGTYSETEMLELVQHVRAVNGNAPVYITGTLLALSKVTSAADSSDPAMNSLYETGLVGKFYGIPKVETRNIHKAGTYEFLLPDDVVNVLPGNIKPIMYVTEGTPFMHMGNPLNNTDFTQEYMVFDISGVSARVPDGEGKFGRYTISD